MSASSRRAAVRSAGVTLLLTATVLPARAVLAQHAGMAPGHVQQGAAPAVTGPVALRWNARARSLVGGHGTGGMATRPLALLSVAQERASRAAAHLPATPVRDLAVATASAGVLASLYPAEAPRFRTELEAERTRAAGTGLAAARLAEADSLGRAAAARVLARAATDNSGAAWPGTVPTGAGLWTSAPSAAPMGAAWGSIRPWVLTSADQFRPAAPPEVDTPAFTANLEEVRQATANRTPAQLASARKWAEMPLPGYWNGVAADLITRARLSDAKAAEVLAALNVALMDANIACFDAKYTHWSIRPSQADPGIDVPVELPNFPAYPSGHACLSAAAAEVLGHHFPARRVALATTAQEIADSRVYAGVHYRLDNDVGMEIGRKVARLVTPAVAAGLDVAPGAAEAGVGGAMR